MVRFTGWGLILALCGVTTCSPVVFARAGTLTAEQIQSIAPGTANCPGDNTQWTYECRTAAQAAPHIEKSFEDYKIVSPGEKAAVLSLMLYESAEFKYNRNHFPGVPGQGTRNMQSPDYNAQYAQAIFSSEKVQKAQSKGGVVGVLNALRPAQYSFASAAWFLTSQCSQEVRQGLQSGTQEGWASYISTCVGTTVNSQRLSYWQKSLQALSS